MYVESSWMCNVMLKQTPPGLGTHLNSPSKPLRSNPQASILDLTFYDPNCITCASNFRNYSNYCLHPVNPIKTQCCRSHDAQVLRRRELQDVCCSESSHPFFGMRALTSHLSRNGFEESTMDIVTNLQEAKLHSETGRQTFSKKIPVQP